MKTTLAYSYCYPQKDAERFEPFLSELEGEFGGKRLPWGVQGSAIDLVTVFEIGVGWKVSSPIVKAIVGKYLDGLLNTDAIKKVGANHRQRVISLSKKARGTLRALCNRLSIMVQNGLDGVGMNSDLAVTLHFQIDDLSCYVVVNQYGIDHHALEHIPQAIDRVVQLKTIGFMPSDAHTSQLFFDFDTGSWRYLFVPTNAAFGHHIDRYIDLKSSETLFLSSNREFIERFSPSYEDQLKFLVSPFRE